jgi:hypothetical protein
LKGSAVVEPTANELVHIEIISGAELRNHFRYMASRNPPRFGL